MLLGSLLSQMSDSAKGSASKSHDVRRPKLAPTGDANVSMSSMMHD